jgi:hypothetical protein
LDGREGAIVISKQAQRWGSLSRQECRFDIAEVQAYRGEIEILTSFADGNAFNWMDAQDRRRFKAALY